VWGKELEVVRGVRYTSQHWFKMRDGSVSASGKCLRRDKNAYELSTARLPVYLHCAIFGVSLKRSA
jgi:hypothetical protein